MAAPETLHARATSRKGIRALSAISFKICSSKLSGAVCYHTLEEALEHCAGDDEVFIIGGESVYRQAMPFADCLYLTEVDDTASEADAFFPEVDKTVWKEKSRVRCSADEKHLCSYSFVDYERE